MAVRIATALAAGLALAGAGGLGATGVKQRPVRSTNLPGPRNGDVAVRQELEAARRAGTVEAYDLFLARHGDDPLARVARKERQRLRRPGGA